MSARPHHFVFLLYPEVSLSSLTGTMEVLEQAMLEQELHGGPGLGWRISLVSPDGGRTPSYFGVTLETRSFADLAGEPIDTIFVSGGLGYRAAMADDALLGWLRETSPRAGRICASGTGSFILAAAGLLDRRRVVTHWLMHDEFSALFPEIELVRDRLYIQDGNCHTSAGMGSAVEFALSLLEEDAGRDFAFRIAKRTLIMMRRSGEQPQISSVLAAQAQEGDRFDRLHEWIHANLKADLSVEALAAHVGMSGRNFSRVYSQKMGMTPAGKVMQIRLEAAHEALLHSDARISTIAYECGFSDEQHMRRAFMRWLGKSPSDLRQENAAG
jgi:transcriptional regulator GlxA family with amidase domain